MAGSGGGILALFTSVIVPAATIFGAYTANESRRSQNYRMVLDTLQLSDAGAAPSAGALFDVMTNDRNRCPTYNEMGSIEEGGGFFRGLRCDLSWAQRKALANMIDSKAAETALTYGYRAATPQPYIVVPSEEPAAGPSGPLSETMPPAVQYKDAIDTVVQLNDPDTATRLAAGQRLVDNYTGVGAALDRLIAWLSPAQIGDLSSNGRYNVIYFMGRMQPRLWTPDRVSLACEGLALIEKRADDGVAALGDQTRGVMDDLRKRLAQSPSGGCTG